VSYKKSQIGRVRKQEIRTKLWLKNLVEEILGSFICGYEGSVKIDQQQIKAEKT
jgi:hypothetical protein